MEEQKKEDFDSQLLQIVNAKNYHPIKPKAIARKLSLDADGRRMMRRAVKRLVKRGKIRYGSNHVVYPIASESTKGKSKENQPGNEITGLFQRAAAGFGFVRPDGAKSNSRENDIFIPKESTADAAKGDRVRVRLNRGRSDDRRKKRGEIVEVIERRVNQFVGVYLEHGGHGFVQIDGRAFSAPILVGDAGAKNAREGDKVVIQMVHYPSAKEEGEAVITEVLGPRGEAEVDTLSVMRAFELPGDFSEAAIEDARRQAEAFDENKIEGPRRDLRELTVVTIDPKDARDFDDAISLEQLDNGHFRLGVHVADVSHFVKTNSPLDVEARNRATSIYLPDRVIPMIPEIISNNLASLQPDRVRYAKTVFIEWTPDGIRTDTECCSSAIKSDRRFNYEEVDEFINDRGPWRDKLDPKVFSLLERMHGLAMTLRKRRKDGGAIELSMPEVKIDFDDKGDVKGAHLTENTESHQIIEEFMLAANEAVADHLHRLELAFLRRIHESPDSRKLKQLTTFVRQLGIDCESLESRFEIQRVIDSTAGRPTEYAIHYAVLRSMQKAIYAPDVEGHYALNMNNYCHFTSPIRRYPDLVIHRMVDALENELRPVAEMEQLLLLGEHCSGRERRAEAAERELIKLKMLNFLSEKTGETMPAVITGVEDFGLFAQGVDLPAEGFISIDSLEYDHFEYDSATHTLMGRKEGNQFRLGDLIQVEIHRVDVDRRELDFRLAERPRKPRTNRTSEGRLPFRGAKSGGRKGKKNGAKKGGKNSRSGGRGKGQKRRK